MVDNSQPRFSLRDACRVLFRHKRKVCVFFSVVVVLVTAVTLLSSRVYRSQGKLLVRLGRENATLDATSTLGNSPVVAVPHSREQEMNSIVEILTSRVLAERVVDEIGPAVILGKAKPVRSAATAGQSAAGSPPIDRKITKSGTPGSGLFGWSPFEPLSERDRGILEFQENLSVEAVKESNILSVTYDATDRELSRLAVERLMQFFLELHVLVHRTPGAHEFLNMQMQRAQKLLAQSETKLRDLKNKTGLAAPADQRGLLVGRIDRLENELLQTESALVAAQVEVELMQKTLRGAPDKRLTAANSGVANDAVDSMRGQLYALELKEQELLAKFNEQEPEVLQVQRQIVATKKVLESEEEMRRLTKWPRQTYEATQLALLQKEVALSSYRATSRQLEKQLQTARQDLKTLNGDALEIDRLQRDVQIQDATFRRYAEHLEQAHIDQALQSENISNVNIVQPAQSFIKPVRPRKLLNLVLAIAFGLFGGLALALLAEHVDHSFTTPQEIEQQLDIPLLVSIPRMNAPAPTANGKE
jgi:uncharacterized protein involved in exopolysaccharide biosynthesis